MEKFKRFQPAHPKLTGLPFRKIAPNIVTMLALCAGVTSIRYAIQDDWVKAIICIFLAALFDGLRFGWFFCLLFACGMAMRLARFNTMLDEEPQPEYWHHFFVGVPAPAAAALAITPIMVSFDNPELLWLRDNNYCAALMCVVALLMVSRIPTVSTKKWRVPGYMFIPLMLLVALFASFIITAPWLTLGIMIGLYALSIPFGVICFLKLKHNFERNKA